MFWSCSANQCSRTILYLSFSCCFCFDWISSAMRNRTAYSRLNVYHNRRKEKSELTNRSILKDDKSFLSDANAGRFNTADAVGLVLTASPFIDCPIASEYVGVTLCSSSPLFQHPPFVIPYSNTIGHPLVFFTLWLLCLLTLQCLAADDCIGCSSANDSVISRMPYLIRRFIPSTNRFSPRLGSVGMPTSTLRSCDLESSLRTPLFPFGGRGVVCGWVLRCRWSAQPLLFFLSYNSMLFLIEQDKYTNTWQIWQVPTKRNPSPLIGIYREIGRNSLIINELRLTKKSDDVTKKGDK